MDFNLSDEQQQLRDTLARFVDHHGEQWELCLQARDPQAGPIRAMQLNLNAGGGEGPGREGGHFHKPGGVDGCRGRPRSVVGSAALFQLPSAHA